MEAPIIVGTARKNENSAAVLRPTPIASAPMIVAPERLTPGIIDTHCARPTPITFLSGRSATPTSAPGLEVFSIARIAMPPAISAQPTIAGVPSITSIWSLKIFPSTAEGSTPMMMLRAKRSPSGSRRSTPIPAFQKVFQYCTTTARIAPSWITTLNIAHCAAS